MVNAVLEPSDSNLKLTLLNFLLKIASRMPLTDYLWDQRYQSYLRILTDKPIKQKCWLPLSFFKKIFICIYSFIWLHPVWVAESEVFDLHCIMQGLLAAVWKLHCDMMDLVPWQGLNPGPLHWKYGVLTTGPLGKSLTATFLYKKKSESVL